MSKQENERIYHECIYHIKEDKYKTHELDTGTNGKTHTLKRGTRSENKENENNADWRELKSYTSHEVRIFLTVDLSGPFYHYPFLCRNSPTKNKGNIYISFMRHVGHS